MSNGASAGKRSRIRCHPMSLPTTFAALQTKRPPVIIKATFQAYSHQEDVELEMPANFWKLPKSNCGKLMDTE